MNDSNDFCKCGHQRYNHLGKVWQCKDGVCSCKKFRLYETYKQFLERTEKDLMKWHENMERTGQ